MDELARAIIDRIALEWQRQGHHLTGAFEQALTYEIDGETIRIYDNKGYGSILNKGVPAEQIPFSPGSGAKTSRYIQGLANYAKLRMGVNDKLALSIAFAIAYTHKREGMPSKGSVKYSSTGKRIQFVEDGVPEIERLVDDFVSKKIMA